MDIDQIKVSDRVVEIVHPSTKAVLGIRVTIMSLDDERMSKLRRTIIDRRNYLEARGKPLKAEEIEENSREVVATAILGWEWYNPTGKAGDNGYDADAMPEFNGGVPEFTKRNTLEICKKPWFRNQVNEALGESESFFDDSKSS